MSEMSTEPTTSKEDGIEPVEEPRRPCCKHSGANNTHGDEMPCAMEQTPSTCCEKICAYKRVIGVYLCAFVLTIILNVSSQ